MCRNENSAIEVVADLAHELNQFMNFGGVVVVCPDEWSQIVQDNEVWSPLFASSADLLAKLGIVDIDRDISSQEILARVDVHDSLYLRPIPHSSQFGLQLSPVVFKKEIHAIKWFEDLKS